VDIAYLFVGVDVLVLLIACLPMRWARSRADLRWLYGLFVLLLVTVPIGIIGTATAAQWSSSDGALVVMVYLGPAFVFSAIRLTYEGNQVFRRRTGTAREQVQ
jgi:hypothetical protein